MPRISRTKTTSNKSAKRRQDLRRNLPKPSLEVRALLLSREFFNLTVVLLGMLLIVSVLIIWAREQVKVLHGQIMTETRLRRVEYSTKDEIATERAREKARVDAPRIYTINESHLSKLESSVRGLPRALANQETLEQVSPELIEQFRLTEAGLSELRRSVDANDQTTTAWNRYVNRLVDLLRERPLFDSEEFQQYTTSPAAAIQTTDGDIVPLPSDKGIELQPEMGREATRPLRELVEEAGFTTIVKPLILARILFEPEPLALFDAVLTERKEAEDAANVKDVLLVHPADEVIYKRGDVLNANQYDDLVQETRTFSAQPMSFKIWQPRLGMLGLNSLVLLFIGIFIFVYYPRISRNMLRVLAIAGLMTVALFVSIMLTVQAPKVIMGAALAPTLFVAIVILLAYDKRLALIASGMQSTLVVLALELSVGWFLLLLAGSAISILQLREVRNRNSLIRAATVTAAVVAMGTIALGLLELPLTVQGIVKQVGLNAMWAITASYLVGFVVLGILPLIETWFGITTGMTLAELRDPRQSLLRQLQQKAPGTYNHSLQVANIAEAAADAIGADSLLIYVGALYHDIGKMSKPEYFIENQSGGPNKHDKLSPAMSLLVIIGHVKDGIELAREYGLPKPLQHFIEAHHGTTLVEYFYHAAKTQEQEGDRKDTVDEVEFRYPGPKPKTKEAAIMMLSDCVESATRAMSEPNPSRIEALVRELSRKRLADGQFDHCDLTFRELSLVEDAIISRVSAIHHGRISYPTGKAGKTEEPEEAAESTPRTASA